MDQLGNRHFHILFHLKFMVRKDKEEGRSERIERGGLGPRGRGLKVWRQRGPGGVYIGAYGDRKRGGISLKGGRGLILEKRKLIMKDL